MRSLLMALLFALLSTSPAQANTPEFVIKVGTVAPDGTPWAKSFKMLKKRIEKASNGRVKMKLFWGGILGGEKSLVRRCARGEVQAIGTSSGAIATLVPEVGVLELPYLFDSLAEADHVLDNFAYQPVSKLLADKGLVMYLWAENGFRSFATKDGAVKTPEALTAKKMRSQETWVHTEWYRRLGASPVQIPVPEVLPSLQTGVVDGYDNTLLYGFAVSWYQAVKHITLTRHIYQPALIVYSKKFFDTLPADIQQLLLSNREAEIGNGRKWVRAMTPKLLMAYKASKKQVHDLTPAELGVFKARAPGVHSAFIKKVPSAKALLDAVKTGKADFAKRGAGR